jgi:sulfopyruvate decarboxylase subunit alpha
MEGSTAFLMESEARTMAKQTAEPLSGFAIIQAIKAAGIVFVISVPDRVTSESVLRPLAEDETIQLVRVCKEDEGVSICAALSICDRRALLLMQHTGLLDSMNALRAIAVEYQQPIVMMVGLLGHESGKAPAQSARMGVRAVPAMLDALGITHEFLHGAGDEERIAPTIERAYASSSPLALLIGRTPS